MTPRKQPSNPKGLLPKLKSFLEGLADRYQRALHVIDEALASDNLKDKIWAVDLILKRTPEPDGKNKADQSPKRTVIQPKDLEQLNEQELLSRIKSYLKEEEP